jgi:glycosyl transferase family 2
MGIVKSLRIAWRLRMKRRRLLFRSFRKRRQLRPVENRTSRIKADSILAFSTVRNEMVRLPYFLEYYRALGVNHFLFVDNDSDDGTAEYLRGQPDVSLWSTPDSYKLSRFGVDWLTCLQFKYGHNHWCLTVDSDEILVYPFCDTRSLRALTDWLDDSSIRSFGTLMLDMYPKGPLDAQIYEPGQDPFEILSWFDSGNYFIESHGVLENLWIQGGVRARCFFPDQPRRAPSLNKTPLVKWNRRYAYVSSTHSLLPRELNRVYDQWGGEKASGVLLHTKFLHTIGDKTREEMQRRQHFGNSEEYVTYYDELQQNPDLWCKWSEKYINWRQLEILGLMSKGNWA